MRLPSPSNRFISTLILSSFLLGMVWFPAKGEACGYDPLIAEMLAQGEKDRWVNWIAELSGARPILTDEGEAYIQTRSSYVLFEPGPEPSAFDYIQSELVNLGFVSGRDFSVHTYAYPFGDSYPERNWKNLILTFPGTDPELKNERVLLVAHLDSTSNQEESLAPGADDNGTGAAGLLEAAAILSQFEFDRTIHLIWFSGEEHSRLGSTYFVEDYADWMPDIKAVINLDMIGFDWDGDRCFEVHAGTLAGSQAIGTCLANVIEAYDLDLTFDYLDDETAYTLSDHYPFWLQGVPGNHGDRELFFPAGWRLRRHGPQLPLPPDLRYPRLYQPGYGVCHSAGRYRNSGPACRPEGNLFPKISLGSRLRRGGTIST